MQKVLDSCNPCIEWIREFFVFRNENLNLYLHVNKYIDFVFFLLSILKLEINDFKRMSDSILFNRSKHREFDWKI